MSPSAPRSSPTAATTPSRPPRIEIPQSAAPTSYRKHSGSTAAQSTSSSSPPNPTHTHIPLSPGSTENDLERQRMQDVDSARQISRARSGSVAQTFTPRVRRGSRSADEDVEEEEEEYDEDGAFMFPLSAGEKAEMEHAKAGGAYDSDREAEAPRQRRSTHSVDASGHDHRPRRRRPSTSSKTSRRRRSGSGGEEEGDEVSGAEAMLAPNKFDFAHLDAFAAAESSQLGLPFSPRPAPAPAPDAALRQRPAKQRHLALFESAGAPPPSFPPSPSPSKPPATPAEADPYAPPPPSQPDPAPPRPTSGKDYRFSFYSNALPATIHARSLAELPMLGQGFEELFSGRTASPSSGSDTAVASEANKAAGGGGGGGSGAGTPKTQPKEVDPEANTWWLDVLSPTDAEMRMLSKVFGIHPLTTEDIQMEETREKIELFRTYYLVCFRSFDQDPYSPTYLEPLNMYIIVFREGTLSFHFRGTPHPQNVRRRIKQLRDYINVTSDWISYALIDDITDAFGPLIQSIEYEVDSIDELVLILKESEQSDMLRRIGTCRKKVMGLLRLMGNKADVVKGLAKRCNENWSVAPKSDIGLYLSDIQDHLITMTQNLNHYEKILSRSHSNYLAQISIEMTEANNQINNVLSKLTALGTVLIPMNMITGLWGMNVHVPGENAPGLNWFFGILGCLVGIATLVGLITYRCIVRQQ